MERRNQTILDMARSMLKSMRMPNWFSGEEVTATVFIFSRAPTRSVESKDLVEGMTRLVRLQATHALFFACLAVFCMSRSPTGISRTSVITIHTDGVHRVRVELKDIQVLQPEHRAHPHLVRRGVRKRQGGMRLEQAGGEPKLHRLGAIPCRVHDSLD